jgi:DNA-binding transcriptional LysR family regulator
MVGSLILGAKIPLDEIPFESYGILSWYGMSTISSRSKRGVSAMDIRHFRYFLAVADHQTFVGGAKSLNMTQPPLSKRISDFEEEIGTRLFIRGSQGVRLTRAGEKLLPHARKALASFQAAEQYARDLAQSGTPNIRIAIPPESSRELIEVLRSRLEREGHHPHFIESSTADQIVQISKGIADLGLPRYPFDPIGLEILPPLAQPLGVLISARHPLAKHSTIRLQHMSPYPIVIFPRELSPGLHDELLASCRAGGYDPKRIFHSFMTVKNYLQNDMAVTLLVERKGRKSSSSKQSSEFVWRPLEGNPIHWWTSVVYRSFDRSRKLKMIAYIIDDCLRTAENWVGLRRPEPIDPGRFSRN